jgi:hypothetical protein
VVTSCRQLQEADSLQWDDSAVALLQPLLLGLHRDSFHHQQGEWERPRDRRETWMDRDEENKVGQRRMHGA